MSAVEESDLEILETAAKDVKRFGEGIVLEARHARETREALNTRRNAGAARRSGAETQRMIAEQVEVEKEPAEKLRAYEAAADENRKSAEDAAKLALIQLWKWDYGKIRG